MGRGKFGGSEGWRAAKAVAEDRQGKYHAHLGGACEHVVASPKRPGLTLDKKTRPEDPKMKTARLIVVWSFFLTFVSAQKIEVHYDKSHDFSNYKTYGWAKLDKLPIIRVDEQAQGAMSDEQLDRRLRSLVEAHLDKKKFQKEDGQNPDFLVSYLAVAQFDLTERGVDAGASGYGSRLPSDHWRPFYDGPDSYSYGLIRKGTLAIDVIDRETGKLVWRGTAQGTFSKPQEVAKKLDKIVGKIVKKFPPK